MKPTHPLLAALAFASLLPAGALRAAAEKTYPVNLSVPSKVGDKASLVTTATMEMQVAVNLKAPDQPAKPVQQQQQKRVVRLEADAEVLAVFPNGGLQKAVLTVKVLRAAVDGQPEKEILPAGSKIVAEKTGDKNSFTVDGKPAAADVAELIGLAFELGDANHTDQEASGPKNPVAVGGTWPVNGAIVAEQFKKDFGDGVTGQGSMKLEAIKGEGDSQVAFLSGTTTLANLQATLPPPFVTKSSVAKLEMKGTVAAVHKGTESVAINMSVKLAAEAPGPDGAQLTATTEMIGEKKSEITYH